MTEAFARPNIGRMDLVRMILKELAHRRVNAALGWLAVTTAVTLAVAFFTTAGAAERETVRLTRDMGFNLRIIPKSTDMDFFWREGFSNETLPEEAIQRLAKYERVFLTYNHLVASLERRFVMAGKDVLLSGLAPAITAPATRQRPMGYRVEPGTVLVGYQVARDLGLKAGGEVSIGARSFRVERCLAESGTEDDVRVFGPLKDVQEILGLKGRINEIKAIDCLCLTADQDPLSVLRKELAQALPDATVLQLRTLADARARQRHTSERLFAFVLPLVLTVCAIVVAALAALNVRERRLEVGVLRALGHGSARVASLFLGRAALVGVAAALAGFALGSALALSLGPRIFPVTAASLRWDFTLLGWSLALTPLFAMLASLVPAASAATQDPAEILRES